MTLHIGGSSWDLSKTPKTKIFSGEVCKTLKVGEKNFYLTSEFLSKNAKKNSKVHKFNKFKLLFSNF